MQFKELVYVTIAGLLAVAYKMLKEEEIVVKRVATEILGSIIISLAIIPAIVEKYHLTVSFAVAMSVIMTIFTKEIMEFAKRRIDSKN